MNAVRPWLTLSLATLLTVTASAQSVPHNANTSSQPVSTPADGPPARQRIGLVLGGGGALGLTEIGVLQWFEENHIPVDVIAGTSMGCMLSAFYATGKSPKDMQQITNAAVFSRVFRLTSDYRTMSYRRRQDERRVPGSFSFGLRHGLSLPRSGVLADADLNAFLTAEFLPYGDDRDFNSFPIPLRCVATDINKGELHIFREGSVAIAVRASISVPGVFPALQVDDHTYIDGAILENLPTETEQAELKPDVMIAVSIPLEKTSGKEAATLFGILGRSFSVASWANEQRSRKLASVVIEPDVKNLTSADYAKAEILTKTGYESAEKNREALLKYRIDDAAWQRYQDVRHGRVPPAPKLIRTVDVKGPTPKLQNSIEAELKPLEGKPLNPETINATLEDLRSDGRFAANYSVTHPGSDEGGQVHFRVQDKPGGPPFLLLGLNVIAQSGPGASRTTLEGTYLHQDLGGYRSELRGKMAYGYLTNLDFEYYRRLSVSGWFAAPRGFFLRTPVYIFQNQKVAAERTSTSGGGAMDFGYSFAQKAEFRAGWEGYRQRWTTKTGTDGKPDFSTTTQTIRARYTFDLQDRALIPKHGWRGDFSGGYLLAGTGENAPKVTVSASYFFRTWLGNSVSLGGEGGTLFNKRVADPFLFTLGGPLRLSASGLDEYRGTDYWLARPMYLRRLGTLPAPLGQSFYIFTALEAGQMRSPYNRTQLRSDVYLGFTSETPLGVITIGPSFGDGGRRKFVFTLGRFF